jgi:hypothetical protein
MSEDQQYNFPFFDDKGHVHCQICGESFLVISPQHLKHRHNINYKAYTLRFPDAPLKSDEFVAKGKFGKMKSMFPEREEEELKKVDVEELEEESTEEPVSEEKIKAFYAKEVKKSKDPIKSAKNKIFSHLKTYYTNIKMDYMVQEFSMDGKLQYEAISDFCDPVLKVVINFPDTFWHNRGNADPQTNQKLRGMGWQVIEIGSPSPSIDAIDAALEQG